jgi:hypothetical protein
MEVELHPKSTDAEAVAQFKYENKTNKTINIKNVRTSCGCTVASLKKNDVAPGEKGEVTATYKVAGHTGTQTKTVTVETDDPAQPTTNLVLKAVIAETIHIEPPFVTWENGEAAKPKTITVKALDKDLKMTKLDVTSSSPDFTTNVEKGKSADEFIINVSPKDTSAMHAATLTIKPDSVPALTAVARVIAPAGVN